MRIHKDHLKIFCFVLLITSVGFDRASIRVGEVTLRFSYLLFFATFVWLYLSQRIKAEFSQTLLLIVFTLLAIPSWLISYNPLNSIAYIGWIWVNYIFIFLTFAFLAKHYSLLLYRSVLYSFRLQILAGWLLILLGINLNETIFVSRTTDAWFNAGRAYLLYYEPSFFAIALSSYVAIIIDRLNRLGLKSCYIDLTILTIGIYSTKSATLLLAIIIAVVVSSLTPKLRSRRILLGAIIGIILSVGAYGYAMTQKDLVANTLHAVITSDDPIRYLMIRSGGRVVRMTCAWDVFWEHPFWGVGIGAYEAYSRNIDLTYCIRELDYPVWSDVITNQPAISIYVELLATTGVFAATSFFLFLLRILFFKRLSALTSIQYQYWLGLVIILVIMATQANYLTLCIWMAMGIYFGSVQRTKVPYEVVPPKPVATPQVPAVAY